MDWKKKLDKTYLKSTNNGEHIYTIGREELLSLIQNTIIPMAKEEERERIWNHPDRDLVFLEGSGGSTLKKILYSENKTNE